MAPLSTKRCHVRTRSILSVAAATSISPTSALAYPTAVSGRPTRNRSSQFDADQPSAAADQHSPVGSCLTRGVTCRKRLFQAANNDVADPVVPLRSSPKKAKAVPGEPRRPVAKTRTASFGARWSPTVAPHTLILGTHPSVTSLGKQQYYAHPMK
jgi:hypothetical protein